MVTTGFCRWICCFSAFAVQKNMPNMMFDVGENSAVQFMLNEETPRDGNFFSSENHDFR